jgi:hypothetical protein
MTTKNFHDLLGEARLPEKTVDICLRGDLVADFEDLERQLEEAAASRSDALDAGADVAEIAQRLEALTAEMREHTYAFRLRAMPKPKFRQLIADHPPRKVVNAAGEEEFHERDRMVGLNYDTFFDALVRGAVVDPELTNAEFDLLLDEKLTDQQFGALSDAAWNLNVKGVDIPFSPAASQINRSTAPGSKSLSG